ncbi:TetR/AcrR family transcriptional regulator [Pseudonocardia ailaonensis]|uniref:TetR/AcrR family transcriptional regulator n=1 Tax=Pseudonocardia ailaonensis TaxID=367279 RepID=A0ABN2NN82_9PSEU
MPRPKVHDDELRERLRERAGELLTAHGVEGLSLRTLASDVGTSTTAVYALFGGKPGLVKSLVDDAFRQLGRTLAGVPAQRDPAEQLVALGEAYRSGALADPHLYDAMFDGSALDAGSRALQEEAFAPLVAAVERARDERVLRADAEPATVVLGLWAVLHGLVSIQLHAHTPRGADDPTDGFAPCLRAAVDGWRVQTAPN